MILTNCAACAAPLPRLAKQCSMCQTRYKDFENAFLVVIEPLRNALTEQLDWSLDDLGMKLDAAEMKFIYAFYDLAAGDVCISPETRARDVKKLVSDFEKEGGLAKYQ